MILALLGQLAGCADHVAMAKLDDAWSRLAYFRREALLNRLQRYKQEEARELAEFGEKTMEGVERTLDVDYSPSSEDEGMAGGSNIGLTSQTKDESQKEKEVEVEVQQVQDDENSGEESTDLGYPLQRVWSTVQQGGKKQQDKKFSKGKGKSRSDEACEDVEMSDSKENRPPSNNENTES